jgi:hypothetical protein
MNRDELRIDSKNTNKQSSRLTRRGLIKALAAGGGSSLVLSDAIPLSVTMTRGGNSGNGSVSISWS